MGTPHTARRAPDPPRTRSRGRCTSRGSASRDLLFSPPGCSLPLLPFGSLLLDLGRRRLPLALFLEPHDRLEHLSHLVRLRLALIVLDVHSWIAGPRHLVDAMTCAAPSRRTEVVIADAGDVIEADLSTCFHVGHDCLDGLARHTRMISLLTPTSKGSCRRSLLTYSARNWANGGAWKDSTRCITGSRLSYRSVTQRGSDDSADAPRSGSVYPRNRRRPAVSRPDRARTHPAAGPDR